MSEDLIPSNPDESFGQWLRQQRGQSKCTLEEIAAVTKVHIAQLKMIEEDRWETLPAPTFVRGFLLCYARHINLPEEEVLRRYKEQALRMGRSTEILPEIMRQQPAPPKSQPRAKVTTAGFQGSPGSKNLEGLRVSFLTLPRLLLILGLAATLGLVSWLISIGKSEGPPKNIEASQATAPAPTGAPAVSPEALPQPEPPTPSAIDPSSTAAKTEAAPVSTIQPGPAAKYTAEIRALEDNWVNARVDSEAPKGFQLKAGTVRTFEAQKSIQFVFSNSGVVELRWNGVRYGPVGYRGDVKTILLPDELDTLQVRKPPTVIPPRQIVAPRRPSPPPPEEPRPPAPAAPATPAPDPNAPRLPGQAAD